MRKIKRYRVKFLKTIKQLLTKGVTPEKLGVTVMLGFLFGIIPILGINTLILAAIALRWRLNMGIIQIINYAAYPLQMILMVPFFKTGQWIFRNHESINFAFSDYKELFTTNFLHAASELSFFLLKGLTVWLLVSIPIGILIYNIFVYFFKNLLVRVTAKR